LKVDFDDAQTAALNQFSRQSERYGKGHILQNIEDVALALQNTPFRNGAKALDVATGGGHTGLYLASLGYDVTLADIAQPMLDRAAEAALERGVTIKTALHAAEQLPYPDETFDLVTCRVAAHHFSSPDKFIAETARVLKRGGHFLLIDGTVSDDQAEAQAWIHTVEKLRDPSHQRFLTPKEWEALCQARGLTITVSNVIPFKQPDLNWYFETAATPDKNRIKVLEMVARAPESARSLFRIAEEDGKIVWWWQRLTLVAAK
jgi:ubiquinone/menaquinone biosynthesis C-methylase UbiE